MRSAAALGITVLAALGLHSQATQKAYAPAVAQALETAGSRPSPHAAFDEGRKFFSGLGVFMPIAYPTKAVGKPAGIDGIVFYKPGGVSKQERGKLAGALEILGRTRAANGRTYLDVLKAATLEVDIGGVDEGAAGEMDGAGSARPTFTFTTRATAGQRDKILEFKPESYFFNPNAKTGDNVTVSFSLETPQRSRKLARLVKELGELKYRNYWPPGNYTGISLDPGHISRATHLEIARTLVHEAAHGLLQLAHPPGIDLRRQHEKFAYTAGNKFYRDAVRQGSIKAGAVDRIGAAWFTASQLARDRLGLYQRQFGRQPRNRPRG